MYKRSRKFSEDTCFILLDILKAEAYGEDNAIKGSKLAHLFSTNISGIRWQVNYLRNDGFPICSSQKGYFYAQKEAEIDRTIKHLTTRLNGIQTAIDGLEDARKSQLYVVDI